MAHMELRSWERRRERANRAHDMRMAQNADKNGFDKFIDSLERDPV